MKSKNLIVAVLACCLISFGSFAQSKKQSSKEKSLNKGTAQYEKAEQVEPQPVETKATFNAPAPVTPAVQTTPAHVAPEVVPPAPTQELAPAVNTSGTAPKFKSSNAPTSTQSKK